ncbi:hypothetical protein [Croceimicrobium sp.]|uniref:hypothetical protein n=1 Tax=Croceimicrobium sp. TaxID=2828340 RepID=UPI003BAAD33E
MSVVFFSITALVIIGLLFLFHRKMALQMQYLQIKAGKKAAPLKSFLLFDWKDNQARNLRAEAFLLFPMLYAVPIEENEKGELLEIKQKIKRSHVGIYFCLILFIVLGILSEKVIPA